MAGTGTRILLLILFMHIFIFIGVEETRAQMQPFIEDFAHINVSTNPATNLTSVSILNSTMSDYNISSGDSVTSGTGIYLYNPFAPVWGFFTMIWGLITSPYALLTLDIPWVIKLIFIAPLGFAYLLALIGFLRGSPL